MRYLSHLSIGMSFVVSQDLIACLVAIHLSSAMKLSVRDLLTVRFSRRLSAKRLVRLLDPKYLSVIML